MADDIATYFQRLLPVRFPRESGQPVSAYDVFRSWDRFSNKLYGTMPRSLDRARGWRNRYLDAVKL